MLILRPAWMFELVQSGLPKETMRLIKDFTQGPVRISLFHWNNKYLIKLEAGPMEQTFKIDEFDLESEQQLHKLLDSEFLENCMKRFDEMYSQLRQAMKKLEQ